MTSIPKIKFKTTLFFLQQLILTNHDQGFQNCGISDELHFCRQNEITLWGKKRTALFQTHNREKSSFFNMLVRVFAQLCANT